MDDITLRRAQNGDAQAFEALVAPEEQRLWRLCWRYTRSEEDASDCLQETMLKAWRSLPSFHGEAAFTTWLHRIAVNCCLDHLRKTARAELVSLDGLGEEGFDPPDRADGPEEAALKADAREQAAAAVQALPEGMREAVILCALEGESYETAADRMGVSVGTVKSRLSRAREKLRKILPDREPSEKTSVQGYERRARR